MREACEQYDVPHPDDEGSGRKKKKRKGKGAPTFIAQLSYSGTGEATQGRLTVTDQRSRPDESKSWDVPIKCLLCEAVIEEAHDDDTEPNSKQAAEPAAQDAGPTAVDSDTIALAVSTNGVDSPPKAPANRDTEETEETQEVMTGAEMNRKATDAAADTSLLAVIEAATKYGTVGASAGVSADVSPSSATVF